MKRWHIVKILATNVDVLGEALASRPFANYGLVKGPQKG